MELWLVYLVDFTCLHISKLFLDMAVTFYPGRSKYLISHAIILARLHSPPFNCCQSSPRLYSHSCLLMWKAYVRQESGGREKETSHWERTEFSNCMFKREVLSQQAGVKLLSSAVPPSNRGCTDVLENTSVWINRQELARRSAECWCRCVKIRSKPLLN